jgi:hypothetical protein
MFSLLHVYIIITLFRIDSSPQNLHPSPLGVILAIVCFSSKKSSSCANNNVKDLVSLRIIMCSFQAHYSRTVLAHFRIVTTATINMAAIVRDE